jgi:hypothetical protein
MFKEIPVDHVDTGRNKQNEKPKPKSKKNIYKSSV